MLPATDPLVHPDGGVGASGAHRPALRTQGSTLLRADGRPWRPRGASWFGLETTRHAPFGLDRLPLDDGLARLAGLGFDLLRLPFASTVLTASAAQVSGVDGRLNPKLVGRTPLKLLDAVVERADAHGLRVLLDRHRVDVEGQSALWWTPAYPESRWVEDWVMLAERYRHAPALVGVDLHNEPHGPARWGGDDPATDGPAAATRAGNAVLAADPRLLVVVEGVEVSAGGDTTWWGGQLADAAARPVVLDVPDRVVYSPHEYPASVHRQPWFAAADYPANLDALWTDRWGHLVRDGVGPVLLGELGSRLRTPADRQWLDRLVRYLQAHGVGFVWWSFNPESDDTGGLLAPDWHTPEQPVLDALAPLLRQDPGRP